MTLLLSCSTVFSKEDSSFGDDLKEAEKEEHKIEKKARVSSRHAAHKTIHSGSDAQKEISNIINGALRGGGGFEEAEGDNSKSEVKGVKDIEDAEHEQHAIEKKYRQSARHVASKTIHSGSNAQKETKKSVNHVLDPKEEEGGNDEGESDHDDNEDNSESK